MGTLEVALALDNSGSMQGSKIAALKEAANDLVDILFESAKGSTKPDPIKVSVVPFAAGVNVGSQYANASWMDTGAQNPYHADEQRHNGAPSGTNNFSLFNSLKDANGNAIEWGGCVEARPTPYDVTDESASTGNPSTLFVPMFAPDEPDNWTCSSTGSSGSGACPVHACASGGSSCSSSTSSLVYNYAPSGSYSYNNYLPDAGDASAMCGNTFTVTKASPAVFTRANHGLAAGDQVIFSTTGTLYSGLSKTTRYYVLSSGLTTNNFRVSTSKNGSAVNTSGSQSGTHFIANTFTCRSGDQNCARTGSSGKTVGLSEDGGFVSNANCKYGTPSNKAKVANVTVGGLEGGPNFMCTSAPVLPLTTDKNIVKSRIGAMVAEGATGVGEGAMWGWRTLSSGAPFTEGRAYGTKENQKVLVLMTDGANTYYPNSKFVKSWYDVYGYVARGHLGTTSTNSSTLTQAMDTRTLQACTNIKAACIIVYTVGFEISGTGAAEALALMKACASDQDKYFEPNSEAELLAAFNAIGKDISELRISK
jgi:Mg-chelatase subunit ChlD